MLLSRQPSGVLLTLLATCQLALAMGPGVMSDEEWFRHTKNKILILEYDNPFSNDWGRQLAELMGHLTLATITGVDGFAVVTLRQEEERIALTPDAVAALAKKQRTPVVIWGEFYEQKGSVFITSHLRYLPGVSSHAPLELSLDVRRLGVPGKTNVFALPPTSQVNFAPVRVSQEALASIATLWSTNQILRSEPKEDAWTVGMLRQHEPFYLMSRSGEWFQVQPREGLSGWVRLADLSAATELQELAGPVLYGQALLQYLSGNYPTAAESLEKYLANHAAQQDPMNRAWAHMLLGWTWYLYPATGDADMTARALKEFDEAARLVPDSAAPVNCKALAVFKKDETQTVSTEEIQRLERELIHVIQTENDANAVENLQVLYQLPNAANYFRDAAPDYASVREQRLKLLRSLEGKFRKQCGAAVSNAAPSGTVQPAER